MVDNGPTTTLIGRPADSWAIGRMLTRGVATILQEQLPTGEIPTYRPGGAILEYCRSPFISTFVHDALGYFDMRSPWYLAHAVDLVPRHTQPWFSQVVAEVRRRIRAFLLWQEESDGTWRFFGRGSGIDPDADSTSCAAVALWEASAADLRDRWQRHFRALLCFRSEEGRYFSYVTRDRRGYSWMDEMGRPLIGFDRVVNANVLRYVSLVGGQTDELITYLQDEIAAGEFEQGSHDYPNPLCFFYAAARAWRQANLPGRDQLAASILPQVIRLQTDRGDFGGALSTALATVTLLDLATDSHPDSEAAAAIARSTAAIVERFQPWGGWDYESFFIRDYGSVSLTTAMSMMALARSREIVQG